MQNKENLDFLKEYLNTPSPVGNEEQGQKVWAKFLEPFVDEQFVDSYGTNVSTIYGSEIDGNENPFNVAIEAHADEISWYVNHITSSGLIHVIRNGGSDHQIAPSKRVKIHGDNGLIDGIFGWPAIHVRKGKDTAPEVDNITIDVGCTTKEEVEALGVHIGSVVTYPDEFMILNGNKYVARALDNRIGGYMIARVAKRLSENSVKLPFNLHIINSVQEEIGLKGAKMIAERLQPDVAIITDVCHDTTTPMISQAKEGDTKIGDGPVIGYAPAIHKTLREDIISAAVSNNTKFQRLAMATSTGTDTDAFAYSGKGVPSALISLPLRYMHTTVETVHEDDVEACIDLIYNTLVSLDINKYLL